MTMLAATWGEVPRVPGVYAMHGGDPPRTWVAYVGIAGDIQGRLIQHFVRRDSSVVTQSSAVGLNIDFVNHVDWWQHPDFTDADHRHAAEMIAFDVLDPALRSRGNPRRSARLLVEDRAFRSAMEQLFKQPATGRFTPPRLRDVATQVRRLENRLEQLEQRMDTFQRQQPEPQSDHGNS